MKRIPNNRKEQKRLGRHARIRKTVVGTPERPRLCVHRSLKNFSVQLVDDASGRVLMGMSTLSKALKDQRKTGGTIVGATALGEAFGKAAKGKGFSRVSFDRGGYLYHGRVKAFADAARGQGLDF